MSKAKAKAKKPQKHNAPASSARLGKTRRQNDLKPSKQVKEASQASTVGLLQTTQETTNNLQKARLIRSLQRRMGNTRLNRWLQPKVTISPANDPLEREADDVAQRVTSGQPVPGISRMENETSQSEPGKAHPLYRHTENVQQEQDKAEQLSKEDVVQQQESSPKAQNEETQANTDDLKKMEEEPPQSQPQRAPQRQTASAQDVQRSALGAKNAEITDTALEGRIKTPSGGRPLPDSVRGEMEPQFQADFSNVRVHDSAQDRADTRKLNARAFAFGNHIWMGPGESTSNRKLMAHELTHVVQQGGAARKKPSRLSKVSRRVQRGVWEVALEKAASWAREVPGYPLLSVILGKDPISNKRVERNAMNVVHGLVSLIPGGNAMFENLQKSGALQKAFAWLSEELKKLNFTWTYIKGLFSKAWDSLSWYDVVTPWNAWAKIKVVFTEPIGRLLNFAKAVGKKILMFIFEGALKMAGPFGEKVMGVIQKAGAVFDTIVSDPIGFISNLIAAVKKGFSQFSTNILTHLKVGLMSWLFGSLSKAGLQMPEKFDLKGILSIVLQVTGLTYDRIRPKLVKRIGEKRVVYLEKAFEFVKTLVTEGLAGVWQKLLEYIGNLKDMVIGAIRDWVVTKIVTAAVTKVVSMLNPAGAVIQAIMTIYKVIKFFVEKIEQIMALANAVFDSVANIAAGKIEAAANYVEKTMAKTIPLIIGFLADLLGLGGISNKIKKIILGIQAKVDQAVNKLLDFIVAKAASLWEKGKGLAKQGAQKIVQWWKQEKKFKIGKENHKLFFKGEKNAAALWMQSDPRPLFDYVEGLNTNLKQKQQELDKEKFNEYTGYVKQLKTKQQALQKLMLRKASASELKPKYFTENQGEKIAAYLDEIAALLAKFPADFVGEKETGGGKIIRPKTDIGFDGLQTTAFEVEIKKADGSTEKKRVSSEDGKKVTAKLSTVPDGKNTGSGASYFSPLYKALDDFRGSEIAPGHLLNHQVYGSGKNPENLAPITRSANAKMAKNHEETVKNHVLKDNGVAKYTVEIQWNTPIQAREPKHHLDGKMPGSIKSTLSLLKFNESALPKSAGEDQIKTAKETWKNWVPDPTKAAKGGEMNIPMSLGAIKAIAAEEKPIYRVLAALLGGPKTMHDWAESSGETEGNVNTLKKRNPLLFHKKQDASIGIIKGKESEAATLMQGEKSYVKAILASLQNTTLPKVAALKERVETQLGKDFKRGTFDRELKRLRDSGILTSKAGLAIYSLSEKGIKRYEELQGQS